jgi:hypothetical protein
MNWLVSLWTASPKESIMAALRNGGGTHCLYSIYCRNEGVSMAVSNADHSSLESYRILFSKYFRYSNAGGKFKHTCIFIELFFHEVSYTRYDVTGSQSRLSLTELPGRSRRRKMREEGYVKWILQKWSVRVVSDH